MALALALIYIRPVIQSPVFLAKRHKHNSGDIAGKTILINNMISPTKNKKFGSGD